MTLIGPIELFRAQYPKQMGKIRFPMTDKMTIGGMRKIFADVDDSRSQNVTLLKPLLFPTDSDKSVGATITIRDDDVWWMEALGMSEMFEDLSRALLAIKKDIEGRGKKKSELLDEFFPATTSKRGARRVSLKTKSVGGSAPDNKTG